jgi:hypothetical protein
MLRCQRAVAPPRSPRQQAERASDQVHSRCRCRCGCRCRCCGSRVDYRGRSRRRLHGAAHAGARSTRGCNVADVSRPARGAVGSQPRPRLPRCPPSCPMRRRCYSGCRLHRDGPLRLSHPAPRRPSLQVRATYVRVAGAVCVRGMWSQCQWCTAPPACPPAPWVRPPRWSGRGRPASVWHPLPRPGGRRALQYPAARHAWSGIRLRVSYRGRRVVWRVCPCRQ